jgi:hypothetical protein
MVCVEQPSEQHHGDVSSVAELDMSRRLIVFSTGGDEYG